MTSRRLAAPLSLVLGFALLGLGVLSVGAIGYAAQAPLAPQGAPAASFPNAARPVAPSSAPAGATAVSATPPTRCSRSLVA